MADSMFDLSGRVAIVTGASSGIGAQIATDLAAAGANVAVVGRNQARLRAVVDEIDRQGGNVLAVSAELTDPEGQQQVIDQTLAAFDRIDVLALSAGIFQPASFEDMSADNMQSQMEVNYAAPVGLAQRTLPHLERGSSIIFVTSTCARIGFSFTGAYAASKGALDAMMRVMAVELAPQGISVNGISPGWTKTPMNEDIREDQSVVEAAVAATPAGRLATPADISPSVVFLASEAAGFVQGQVIAAEGGYPNLSDVIRSEQSNLGELR